MAANAGETKVKLWEGICYPENMRDDWQDEIDDILQVPFARTMMKSMTESRPSDGYIRSAFSIRNRASSRVNVVVGDYGAAWSAKQI